MNDYMKEAERLAQAYADAVLLGEGNDEARAALLAHIQRGAVPEGWQLVPKEPTPEMLAGGWGYWLNVMAPGKQRDTAAKEYTAMLAAAPAPDNFRDATKMTAEPAEVPMPQGYVERPSDYTGDIWIESQMRTYGDAREAAGYMRGLADERERCASVAWAHYMDTCRRKGIGPDVLPDWCCAAALRGEVKP